MFNPLFFIMLALPSFRLAVPTELTDAFLCFHNVMCREGGADSKLCLIT